MVSEQRACPDDVQPMRPEQVVQLGELALVMRRRDDAAVELACRHGWITL